MTKTKKKLAIVTGLFLVLTIVSPVVVSQDNVDKIEAISVIYSFDKPEIEIKNDVATVSMNDCIFRHVPGEPLVPMFSAKILLPQGMDVKNVVVNHGEPVLLDADLVLEHSQLPAIVGEKPEFIDPKSEIYESNEPYPRGLYDVGEVSGLYGFDILHVNLYPVRYIPKAGKVFYFPEMTVKVVLKDGMINPLYRCDSNDVDQVADMVDNPDVIPSYDDVPQDGGLLSTADYDYVIITFLSFTDDFQPLSDYKSTYTTTNIVDTTYINSNYVGVDLQEKIRNFIIDAYLNWGTTYVLLGGDVEIIPCRGMYGYVPGYDPIYDLPADIYYAGLDGNWNSDGDGAWGEYADNPDYYAEVFVGRAPVSSESQISNFIDKVIGFEAAAKPTRVQLHQSRLQSGNVPDSRTVSEDCARWVPGGYTIDRLYEEDGTVSKTDWINAFNAGPLIVQHTGHGSYSSYGINYQNGGSVSWYNSDALGMSNSFYPIHISLACFSGGFDVNDCLAEAYITSVNGGASACMLNSRYGWFYTTDASRPSGEFIEQQFYELFQNGTEPLGKMMQYAKENLVGYVTPNTGDASCWRWCYYEINLLGDPESPVLTQRAGNQPPTCTLDATPDFGLVPLSTTFTMTASDPDGTIASWALDVDNDGSAEYSGSGSPTTQGHTYNTPGVYTAKLTVWDDLGATGTDTEVVTVVEPNLPPDVPSSPDPYDGETGVGLNPTLSVYVSDPNGDSMDVTFYIEGGGTIGTDINVPSGSYASVEWSGLSYGATYGWYTTADDKKGATRTSGTWHFTTASTPPPQKYYADGETDVTSSSVSGNYLDTWISDDSYEAITEKKTGPRSQLEHRWTITVPGGYTSYIFNVEAYHTANSEGDNFIFAYSTDNNVYHDMFTVYKTSDDDTLQIFDLPATVSGTVYIRVVDADHSKGNNGLDTIFVDYMYIQTSGTPPPNRPPLEPADPTPSAGATNVDISTILSVYVEDPDNDFMDVAFYEVGATDPIDTVYGVASGTYASIVWGGLDFETLYSWYAEADDGEYTSTSDTWSFTTRIDAPPTDMYVSDIDWSERIAGRNIFLSHIVTVMSAGGVVSGATVYSTLTNTDTGETSTFSGVTDATGKVSFEKKCKPGLYMAEVTNILHTSYTYNPGLDVDNPDTYDLE
jgi:hypothetical protein